MLSWDVILFNLISSNKERCIGPLVTSSIFFKYKFTAAAAVAAAADDDDDNSQTQIHHDPVTYRVVFDCVYCYLVFWIWVLSCEVLLLIE